jgi:NAD(P)-dependent dehydrogenase (short-subunit alcohol dehydrogenase family)
MSVLEFSQLFDFSGRSVCVTGAASGIGRATAGLFADLGATVYIADRAEQALMDMASSRRDVFRPVVFDQADICSIQALSDAIGAVDVLINNAAILLYEPLSELKLDDLSQVITINLTGSIALSRLVGEKMLARKQGVIVHTGSQLVHNGAEFRSVYAATKAGVSQFVKTAALEWGSQGIRVNCVAPGRTLTPINQHLLQDPENYAEALKRIPLGRFGDTRDIANAFAFLASDAAAYITGHTLVVDGGWILP